MVEERDEVAEVALSMGGVGTDHPEDWKYSHVGTEERSCAFGAPVGDEQCVGEASRVRASRKARGALAYAGGPFGALFTATGSDGSRTILVNEVTGSADCLAVHLSGSRLSRNFLAIGRRLHLYWGTHVSSSRWLNLK